MGIYVSSHTAIAAPVLFLLVMSKKKVTSNPRWVKAELLHPLHMCHDHLCSAAHSSFVLFNGRATVSHRRTQANAG
jgi:hypothetical protein